ncbi:hypothetical protein NL676_029875 [Syzygium grande]|nr:hypothetical protein NL676_029875 [Syzygium grande]
MGCSESKHDVAAGNTISLSDTSKADEPKEIQKDADTTPEAAGTTSEGANTNGASLPKQKEGESEANLGLGDHLEMSTELRQQAGMLASWARYYAVGGSLKQILRSQGNQKWLPHRVWKVRTGNELGKRPAGIGNWPASS